MRPKDINALLPRGEKGNKNFKIGKQGWKRPLTEFPCGRPGNREAARENMSEDAHKRRIAGLIKTWATGERRKQGEKVVPIKVQRKRRIKRQIKLFETVAKEAREIQDMARRSAGELMEKLIEIAVQGERDSDKLGAIGMILDRAYGKANQTNVNANVDLNGKSNEVTASELDKRVEETLTRIAAITGGAKEPPKSEERPADVCEHNPDTGGTTVH